MKIKSNDKPVMVVISKIETFCLIDQLFQEKKIYEGVLARNTLLLGIRNYIIKKLGNQGIILGNYGKCQYVNIGTIFLGTNQKNSYYRISIIDISNKGDMKQIQNNSTNLSQKHPKTVLCSVTKHQINQVTYNIQEICYFHGLYYRKTEH